MKLLSFKRIRIYKKSETLFGIRPALFFFLPFHRKFFFSSPICFSNPITHKENTNPPWTHRTSLWAGLSTRAEQPLSAPAPWQRNRGAIKLLFVPPSHWFLLPILFLSLLRFVTRTCYSYDVLKWMLSILEPVLLMSYCCCCDLFDAIDMCSRGLL